MCNQLRVEFFKFCRFGLFYFGLFFMAGMGLYLGYLKMPSENIYVGFAAALGDTSMVFMPTLVSAWFVGNDFSNRTIHNEITIGCKRLFVLLVRELPTFLSTVILHFVLVVSVVIGMGIKSGFSFEVFQMQDLGWCVTVMLQLIAMQSIIVLITFVCGKAASSIAVSVCFILFVCNILRNFLETKVYSMSCFCLAQNNSYETLIPTGIAAIVTTVAVVILTWLVFRKKEIK